MQRQVLNKEGFRIDGRRAEESRKIEVEFGVVENVDGSCLYKQGLTWVLATVIGPFEDNMLTNINNAIINCSYVEASYSSSSHRISSKNTKLGKEYSIILQQTFANAIQTELFPSSTIEINVIVQQKAGSPLACAINAVCGALLHAGIPMREIITSTSASVVDAIPILDLTSFEKHIAGNLVTLAVEHFSGNLATINTENRISLENMKMVLDLAASGCNIVATTILDSLRKFTTENDPVNI